MSRKVMVKSLKRGRMFEDENGVVFQKTRTLTTQGGNRFNCMCVDSSPVKNDIDGEVFFFKPADKVIPIEAVFA